MSRRTLTIGSWVRSRYAEERITWDELWMGMAYMIGMRARCVRDQVGAVIVAVDNTLLSVGYVGPPAGMPLDGPCSQWCPRAAKATNGDDLDPGYEDCFSVHAETNCALRLQGRIIGGATLYVTSTMCWSCAKFIAQTGVTRVVMAAPVSERRRAPEKVYELLVELGIEVVFWENELNGYRRVFVETHGIGPHACYFCHVPMPWLEAVHHIDGDHSNDDPENLAAAHNGCHARHHNVSSPASFNGPNPQISASRWTRRKPLLRCATCGLELLPGWLRRHCVETGHTDGGAIATYETEVAERRLTCPHCGQRFETTIGRGRHVMWHRRRGEFVDDTVDELRGEIPQ